MRDDDSSAASMEDHGRTSESWICRGLTRRHVSHSVVDTANAEIRKSLAKDGHFRALLGLLRFEEREVLAAEDDAEQAETDKGAAPPQKHWYLPFSMLAHDLQYNVELIRQYQETPYQSTKPLAKLLKKKKKRVVRERDDDDEPAPRNRADRPEPPGKFLSAQFVDDSGDEDEDERLVMEYRRRMEQMRNADFVEDESEHQAALERIQNELDTEERLAPVRRRTSAGKSGKAAERSDDEEQASEASDEDVASASDSDEVDDDGASAKSTSDDEDEDGSNSDSVNDAAPVDLDGLLSEDSDNDLENELPALASINQNAQSSQVKSPMVAKVPLSETQAASPAFVKRRKLLIADDVGR